MLFALLGWQSAQAAWLQVGWVDRVGAAPPAVTVRSAEPDARNHIMLRSETGLEDLTGLDLKPGTALEFRWEQDGAERAQTVIWPGGDFVQVLLSPGGQNASGPAASAAFSGIQIAPNPFNPLTTVSLTLPQADGLRLELFDVLGRQVTVLANRPLSAGTHRFVVDGAAWASGTYFLAYRLSSGPSGVRRLLLLK